jgi:hypothetical protein
VRVGAAYRERDTSIPIGSVVAQEEARHFNLDRGSGRRYSVVHCSFKSSLLLDNSAEANEQERNTIKNEYVIDVRYS